MSCVRDGSNIFYIIIYSMVNNQQFKEQYKIGKQSEIDSHKDLEQIFGIELTHDPFELAHFDFFNKDKKIAIELKTRPNTTFNNGIFDHISRNGTKSQLDTLYFDAPKLRWAGVLNKDKPVEDKWQFFIVWKCNGEYFYWKICGKDNYFVEEQFRDCGMGIKVNRDVVNVPINLLTHFLEPLNN
jgi:hypothetical protein